MLELVGLTVTYPNGTRAVRDLDLAMVSGESLAIVGESGSGKTTLARSVLGLLPRRTTLTGAVRLDGIDVVGAGRRRWRELRGRVVGYVGQDPFASCDPLRTVGYHVAEAWLAHGLRPPPTGVRDRLAALGIEDPADRMRQHPHEWSGGMLQRATIAGSGVHRPELTIADEPTSALDDELAADVLAALRADTRSLLIITHDLRRVAAVADRIAVMHAGRLVEIGPATEVLRRPEHPYTRSLVAALPTVQVVVGGPSADPVVEAVEVSRTYRHRASSTDAVRDASISVATGEVVGIHGRSGSGKSTLLRLLAGIERPGAGTLLYAGQPAWRERGIAYPRSGWVMPVFQDARASLDPRWSVARTLAEPLGVRGRPGKAELAIVRARLVEVGLADLDPNTRPPRLSGGQCQRVAILRAILAVPALLVADEPTSGLDPVHAAGVARLLRAAADDGAAVVVVSHDRARLASIADRVLTMRAGRLSA